MNNQLPIGADHELDFWKRFITSEQFATWVADGVTPELDERFVEFMQPIIANDARVLDVASGVVSVLNGLVKQINLFCCDVLGDEYRKIYNYPSGILAPRAVPAEDIAYKDMFDVAHIRNGLDHCQDVQKAFDNMVAATKAGGYVIIQGFENEADAENWQGFHQTNLYLAGAGVLMCQTKPSPAPATPLHNPAGIMHSAWQTELPSGKKWFVWIGKKIG